MQTDATTASADLDGAELLITASRLTRWATLISGTTEPSAVSRTLSILDERGPMRVSAFAAVDRTSQPAATEHLKRLESAGLVTRAADPADGRAVLVGLSPMGRDRLAVLRGDIREALAPHLATLDARERAVLAEANGILRRFMADADPAGEIERDEEPR